eukprot:3553889-Rhodomonas_salina.1
MRLRACYAVSGTGIAYGAMGHARGGVAWKASRSASARLGYGATRRRSSVFSVASDYVRK